jgi:hypothetical protein
MKNLPDKFYIAGYAWMIVSLLTTKPVLPLIAIGMMIFCFIMSWVTDYHENNKV